MFNLCRMNSVFYCKSALYFQLVVASKCCLVSCLVSDFEHIFDVDHFILSLRDEVRILRKLPPKLEGRYESRMAYSLSPISWSNLSYYLNQVRSMFMTRVIPRDLSVCL